MNNDLRLSFDKNEGHYYSIRLGYPDGFLKDYLIIAISIRILCFL